jgi:CMP-N,N'-diacetyllegionaminic acid synthase
LTEVLAIIPARGGSKEIPRKNISKLGNKPLLYYTVNAAKKSNLITRSIISTDNNEISKIAKKIGIEVIKRPKKIAGEKSLVETAMKHVLNYLKKKENYIPDVVVLLQITSPFRNEKHIDEALKIFFTKKLDSVFSGNNAHVFVWEEKEGLVFPKNHNPQKRIRRQESKKYLENGAISITKIKSFEKSNSRVSGKTGIYIMPEIFSIEIDTKLDLILANEVLKIIKKNEK